MSTSLTQRIIIVWRYVADAVVIILFCGLSALLGIVAAIAFSPQTPPFTLPPIPLLFIAGVAGIVIVFALVLAITRLEQRKFDEQTRTPQSN
jgi:ABC-type Fe3+-siderophore transport system permease subunit